MSEGRVNILLLGEASGAHLALAKGLRKLGFNVDVVRASNPQNRDGIITMSSKFKPVRHFELLKFLYKRRRKYHIVQVCNTIGVNVLLSFLGCVSSRIQRKIIDSLFSYSRLVYWALGCDNIFFSVNSMVCKGCAGFSDERYSECKFLWSRFNQEADILKSCYEKVFCAMIDYARGLDMKAISYEFLQLPVDLERFPLVDLGHRKRENILVVHPSSSYGFKGTNYIERVFDKVRNICGHNVGFYVLSGMPYREYCKKIKEADVIVDQCLSLSYGMSALEGLAAGKVVVSPNDTSMLGNVPSPFIWKGLEGIESAILDAIEIARNPDKMVEYSCYSRAFLERYHDSSVVAREWCKKMGLENCRPW